MNFQIALNGTITARFEANTCTSAVEHFKKLNLAGTIIGPYGYLIQQDNPEGIMPWIQLSHNYELWSKHCQK